MLNKQPTLFFQRSEGSKAQIPASAVGGAFNKRPPQISKTPLVKYKKGTPLKSKEGGPLLIKGEGPLNLKNDTPFKGVALGEALYKGLVKKWVPIEYQLETFKRSNQDTCLTHKPSVVEGDWVQSGELLTDCASSVGGELALGQNLLIAYMPWEGYNFEDAILISERLVIDDLYTSVHIERYEIETHKTKDGTEEITRDIPDVSEKQIEHLDSFGVVKLGSWVEEGDILVGKITPINKKTISPYQKLLYTILEKQVKPFRDTSLRAPKGIKAKVIDIKYFLNAEGSKLSHSIKEHKKNQILRNKAVVEGKKGVRGKKALEGAKGTKPLQDQHPGLPKTQASNHWDTPLRGQNHTEGFIQKGDKNQKVRLSPGLSAPSFNLRGNSYLLKVNSLMGLGNLKKGPRPPLIKGGSQRQESMLLEPGKFVNFQQFLLKLNNFYLSYGFKRRKFNHKSHKVGKSLYRLSLGHYATHRKPLKDSKTSFAKASPLPSPLGKAGPPGLRPGEERGGPSSLLARKKVPGPLGPVRRGASHPSNSAAILKNLETIHIYLAEKRKIQVGDKMAGRHGNKGIVSQILPIQDMPYLPDGTPIDMVLNPLGVPSRMNVGQIYECLLGFAGKYLGENYKVICFDEVYGPEASRSFVFNKLYEARCKTGLQWLFDPNSPGKIRLYDGRTGDCFDQTVTVGYAYILRLVHMVDDKIHMRSTGPYSLVTQQPLRGRSKQGGQRLGEMEVWALEGFGAAFTLLEMLTIKSDDMTGRMTLWSNLILNKEISIGTPESFKVLICELQALCMDIGLFRYNKSINESPRGPSEDISSQGNNFRGEAAEAPVAPHLLSNQKNRGFNPQFTEINNLIHLP